MSSPQPANRPPRGRRRFQFSLQTLMVLVAVCAVGLFLKQQYDWYTKKRILTQWIDLVLAQEASDDPFTNKPVKPVTCPAALSDAEQIELLEFGTANLASQEHRTGALKLLVERFPADVLGVIRPMLGRPADPEFRALQLFLIGLHRDPVTAEEIMPFLTDDSSPVVRAAAADAIGLIHCPSYRVPLAEARWYERACATVSSPSIDVGEIIALHCAPRKRPNVRDSSEHLADDVVALADSFRELLERMMVDGSTEMERSAAARALISWPPSDYSLRVAEWGVWLNDDGEFKLAQSVIDEIPPFVHHTGNLVDSLADRVNPMLIVSKPIVHLTVDHEMAVDVDVLIAQGRPWFAYPRPNDFSLTVRIVDQFDEDGEPNEPPIACFDPRDSTPLAPASEGYPQLIPAHRTYGGISGLGGDENQISSLGLHWQGLIVSPGLRTWMTPPPVGGQPRFAWWHELRKVSSSWLSSFGEAERFLYYDGPTLLEPPLDVRYRSGALEFTHLEEISREDLLRFTLPADRHKSIDRETEQLRAGPTRRGVFINVDDGHARGCVLSLIPQTHEVAPLESEMLEGDAIVRQFIQLLTEAGLTNDEAMGMYASWKHQFFQTDGDRFLLFLTEDDYDAMCPLVVRPKPTEIVRVGVVLTELDVPGTELEVP